MKRLVLVGVLAALVGCSPDSPRVERDGGGGFDGGAAFDGGAGFDAGMSSFDVGPRPDTGTGECSAVSVEASSAVAPVDIVWVIDNSGSMSQEASLVQANINEFATRIEAAGLDVRVVLITNAGFVTVPDPLGSDASRFMHVTENVQSHDSLEKLLSTLGRYQSFLRRNAALHFVAVSDDESDLPGSSFLSMMQGQLGYAFRFHAVVSPPGSTHSMLGGFTLDGCGGPHGDAADNGDEYWSLAASTGGLRLSICSPDWTVLFSDLTRAISVPQTLPCTYEIPEPPPGEAFDRLLVNVRYTPGDGSGVQTIPYVETRDRCTGEGWYYSGGTAEEPDFVELCPATCGRIETDATGRVDVAFGCATVLI